MAKDESKSEKGDQSTEESKQEFIQIPKEEYEGLKKQVEDTSSYINDTREFIEGASTVINTLAYDPELREKFREKRKGMVGDGEGKGEQQEQKEEKKDNPNPDKEETGKSDKKVDDVVAAQRETIVLDFEKEYGIVGLKDEEKKIVRQKVESYLNDFGWSVQNAPLVNLRKTLEKAYVATHAEKLREEGKLEGITQQRANQMGVMGTFSGGAPSNDDGDKKLSSKQEEWAKKLGVDPEKAAKTYSEREKESERSKK